VGEVVGSGEKRPSYSVKEACHVLIGGEEKEGCEWCRDVWNQLISLNISTLVRRLFHKRLPTKENFTKRGITLNSFALCMRACVCVCVGGGGGGGV
jgi:hypothetical protein